MWLQFNGATLLIVFWLCAIFIYKKKQWNKIIFLIRLAKKRLNFSSLVLHVKNWFTWKICSDIIKIIVMTCLNWSCYTCTAISKTSKTMMYNWSVCKLKMKWVNFLGTLFINISQTNTLMSVLKGNSVFQYLLRLKLN